MWIDVIILISIVGLSVVLLAGKQLRRKALRKQIERLKKRKITGAKTHEDHQLRRKQQESRGLSHWLTKPLPDFKKLGDRLQRAGIKLTTKQFVLRRIIWWVVIVGVVSGLFGKPLLLGISLGVVLGVWLPLKLVDRKIAKFSKAFLKLFPDAIDLIVRGLRSGLPVSESIVLVASEVPEPVAGVFQNVADTMKLGVSMEKAMQETAEKLDMTEFNFFTTSLVLQRETGGNLAEILNNLSEVLRGRLMMRLKIKAMSSEARASAYIIGALPFVVLGVLSVMSPDYIKPLYADYRGNIWGMVALGMMLSGGYVMKRMTEFEI